MFVHGWPDSWRSFQPVLDALPPTVGAVSVSLRGFGGSDAPADGYTPDDFAADVRDVVEHLGVTSAVFVGHSMGTLVVQRLAASHPEIVDGLVLIGGLNRLPDDVFDEVWSVVEDLADPISEQFVREFQSSTLAAPVPAGFFDQLVAESLKAPARVWRAAFAGIRTMPPVDDTVITAPTLLVWGDQDALGATRPAGSPPVGDPRQPPRHLRRRRPQPELGTARTRRPRHRRIPPYSRRTHRCQRKPTAASPAGLTLTALQTTPRHATQRSPLGCRCRPSAVKARTPLQPFEMERAASPTPRPCWPMPRAAARSFILGRHRCTYVPE